MIKAMPRVLSLMRPRELEQFEKYQNYTLDQLIQLNNDCIDCNLPPNETLDGEELGSLIAWVLGRIGNKKAIPALRSAIGQLAVVSDGGLHHCECIKSLAFYGNAAILKYLYEIFWESDSDRDDVRFAIVYTIGTIGYDKKYNAKAKHYLQLIDKAIDTEMVQLKNQVKSVKSLKNLVKEHSQ